MKIIHVCNHFYPCIGGVERAVEGLCIGLIERGHSSDILCLNRCAKGRDRLPQFEKYRGINIIRTPYVELGVYKFAPSIIRHLRGYDLVHVHGFGFFSDFLSILKFVYRKPLVLNTHGGFFHTERYRWLKIIYLQMNRILLKNVDRIIADSKNDEALFSGISQRVVRVPNGIDPTEFTLSKANRNPKNLIFIGRIFINKRLDRLIELVALIKKEVPDVRLFVLGEDWEDTVGELKKMAKNLGVEDSIKFTGKVSRAVLKEHLATAGFYVSASEFEGFGISALEAMAAGCVVVLNDIPVFRELVEHGTDGFLTDFSDAKSAAATLIELMGKDLKDISDRAIETSQSYSWESAAKKMERVYNAIS